MMHLRLTQACSSGRSLPSPPCMRARSSAFSNVSSISSTKSRIHCPPFLHSFCPIKAFVVLARPSASRYVCLRPLVSTAAYHNDDEAATRAQVTKRLETIGNYFRRLGTLSFWGQLVCTVVSAVILAFSVAISGTPTAQATFYLTAGGITAAFLSVFWAFGYIRLSKKLRTTAHDLIKAPPRAEVVNQLKNGAIINLLGMGLTLLGMEATVGTLVAKSLTSSAGPTLQGIPAGYNPVLALDVFLVQASVNTVVAHFLGLVTSLELLRAVNKSPPPESALKPA